MPRIKSSEEIPSTLVLDPYPKKYTPRIGYRNIAIPLGVGSQVNVSIDCDMTQKTKGVNLDKFKSFVENSLAVKPTSLTVLSQILDKAKKSFECNNISILLEFVAFKNNKSFVDEISSLVPYKKTIKAEYVNSEKRFFISAKVPFIASCPRSKEISDYGILTSRGEAELTVRVSDSFVDSELDLVSVVEKNTPSSVFNEGSCIDNSFLTELAYENPMYPEDVCRKIAMELDSYLDSKISDYRISVEQQKISGTTTTTACLNAGRVL